MREPKRNKPWQKQEARLATELNGRRVPASGAKSIKGDVQTDTEFIEAKTTSGKSYALSVSTLSKLETQSIPSGKRPILILEFTQGKLKNKEWVVLPREDYDNFRTN